MIAALVGVTLALAGPKDGSVEALTALQDLPSLRELAPPGLVIGASIGSRWLNQTNTTDAVLYRALIESQFSVVLADKECKWHGTEEQGPQKYTLDECRAIVELAAKNKQHFRGHNLCWDVPAFNPDWLNAMRSGPADAMRAVLRDHVQTVIKGAAAAGPVYAWDVVNEAIGCDKDVDGVTEVCSANGTHYYGKPGTWAQKVPDYIDVAFRAARAAMGPPPHGPKLILSDFDVIANSEPKLKGLLDVASGLQKRGVPIDGIACQTHAKLSRVARVGGETMAAVENFIKEANRTMSRIAAMGLDVHISEMNVDCDLKDGCGDVDAGVPPTAERVAMQSRLYAGILENCISQPRCTTFEFWDFIDGHSQMEKNPYAEIFDEHFDPKPQFWAMVSVLKGSTASPAR